MAIIDRFLSMVQHNTNAFAEFIRLGVLMLMLFEYIHWTEPQMFGFLAFLSAGLALITGKTTVPSVVVDQKVDEKVAHREMTKTTGTGSGLIEPKALTGNGK